MRGRMLKSSRQAETERLVALYNMGMLSRKYLMNYMGLGADADSKTFWRRHERDEDEAAATWKVRLFGG